MHEDTHRAVGVDPHRPRPARPYAPVATYWPEFAANGKQDIEIRHLLSHTSGVSGWEVPFDVDDVYDWEKSTSPLAGQAPWWEPGTASGYHAINYGHLIGEVIRRITGKTLKDFVRDEIADPLDADVQIGARAEDDRRIAELIPPPPLDLAGTTRCPRTTRCVKTFAAFRAPPASQRSPRPHAWRRADIGGANGHGNARGTRPRIVADLVGRQRKRRSAARPATIDLDLRRAVQRRRPGAVHCRYGLASASDLPTPESVPAVPDGKVCWWGGWGGSIVVMNPDRRATFAYVMNKMGPGTMGNDRTNRYARLFDEAFG